MSDEATKFIAIVAGSMAFGSLVTLGWAFYSLLRDILKKEKPTYN